MWLWATILLTVGGIVGAALMAPSASVAPIRGLSWLLFLGSSVHVASTGWLYTVPGIRRYASRRPMRYVVVPLCLIAVAAVSAALMRPAMFAWLLLLYFLLYFAWQFFHFQKQNLGMSALAATSHHLPSLRPAERRALILAGIAGIAGLMARPRLLQLDVHPPRGCPDRCGTWVTVP